VQVFLSYRRSDVGGYAGRLTDALSTRLGARNVFQDVTAIAPGQDFTVALDEALGRSDAVLAVIGPGWLTAADAAGASRLAQPDDYVRRELSRALERGALVVPILVGGALLPSADQLPAELAGLAQRQAVALRDESWHQDVDGLLRSLRGEPTGPAPVTRPRWLVPLAVLVMFAVVAGVVLFVVTRSPGGGSGGDSAGGTSTTTRPCTGLPTAGWHTMALISPDPSGTFSIDGGQGVVTVTGVRWRQLAGGHQVIVTSRFFNNGSQANYPMSDYQKLSVFRQGFSIECINRDEDIQPSLITYATIGYTGVPCRPSGQLVLRVQADNEPTTYITLTPGQPATCGP